MKIALIQLNTGNNINKNIVNACSMVKESIEKGADFILLPELFNFRDSVTVEYLYNNIAESVPGKSLLPLMDMAKEFNVNILAGSIYERCNTSKKIYNTSVVINNKGRIICKYRKINLFKALIGNLVIDESSTFENGRNPVVCQINNWKIGLSICYDLRFPELYRNYFNQAVDIIVVPSSFTYSTGRLHWEVLLRARAIENYCYVLAPNQYGIDGNGAETYGHSMIVDPYGKVTNCLRNQEAGIVTDELKFTKLAERNSIHII
ncbi:carbon-nitrogen hydrolase family protein [bacterium]|nr:carbon-nitrogen hydrolase family protein [bacterium]